MGHAHRFVPGERYAQRRERILSAAYELFSRSGVRAVGVDAITEHAGVAKMTLYRNFKGKNELAMAFLQQREERWLTDWVQAETQARATTPAQRLLAIFDIFTEWFERDDFEGCPFVTSLLEFDDREDPVRQACVRHLANVRAYLCELATEAGALDPERFAAQWHILIQGSIIAAHEGDLDAAAKARELGVLLLDRELEARACCGSRASSARIQSRRSHPRRWSREAASRRLPVSHARGCAQAWIAACAGAVVVAALAAGCGDSKDDSSDKAPSPAKARRRTRRPSCREAAIAFRRFLDEAQTHGAIFTIDPDRHRREAGHGTSGGGCRRTA